MAHKIQRLRPCNFLWAERLLHAHGLWQGAPGGPAKVDWDAIAEQVTAGSPPCREWVQDLLAYVKGTDPAGDLLSQLAHCEKTFTPPSCTNRVVGSEFFKKINSLPANFHFLKNAFLKVTLTGGVTKDIVGPGNGNSRAHGFSRV